MYVTRTVKTFVGKCRDEYIKMYSLMYREKTSSTNYRSLCILGGSWISEKSSSFLVTSTGKEPRISLSRNRSKSRNRSQPAMSGSEGNSVMSQCTGGNGKGGWGSVHKRSRKKQQLLLNAVMELHRQQEEMQRQQGQLLVLMEQGLGCIVDSSIEECFDDYLSNDGRDRQKFKITTKFILSQEVCTDWTFKQMFNVQKDLFHHMKKDMNASERAMICCGGGALKSKGFILPIDDMILIALATLRSGKYEPFHKDNHVIDIGEVREIVKVFCSFVSTKYGDIFMNRRPAEKEVECIEKSFSDEGFPGCIGFLESVVLEKEECNLNMTNNSGQKIGEKCNGASAVELWVDKEGYCWSWSEMDRDLTEKNNSLSASPVISGVFDGDISLSHESGYVIAPSCVKRHLLYFNVEGKYPPWPIFIEGRGMYQTRMERYFEDGVVKVRKFVDEFFSSLKRRFPVIELNESTKEVRSSVIILNNFILRSEDRDKGMSPIDDSDHIKSVVDSLHRSENDGGASHASHESGQTKTEKMMDVSDRESLERDLMNHLHLKFGDGGFVSVIS